MLPGYASDFANAQKTYVPPTLIHRDLDALGTGKWNLYNPNTGGLTAAPTNLAPTASTPTNPIDSLLSTFGGGGGAAGSAGTAAGATAGAGASNSLSTLGNALLTGSQYIPGVNKISGQISTLVSNGQLSEAENVARPD